MIPQKSIFIILAYVPFVWSYVEQCPQSLGCSWQYSLFESQHLQCYGSYHCPVGYLCCPDCNFQHYICKKSIVANKETKELEQFTEKFCPIQKISCSMIFPYESTKHLLCDSDSKCPNGSYCCMDNCFEHRVCKIAAKSIIDIKPTAATKETVTSTEKVSSHHQTEVSTPPKVIFSSEKCPKPEHFCDKPKPYELTKEYECDNEKRVCSNGHICCKDSCFSHNICKKAEVVHNFCPKDLVTCSKPLPVEETKAFECDHKERKCLEGHVCCQDSCYTHKICKKALEENPFCPKDVSLCDIPLPYNETKKYECNLLDKHCSNDYICCKDSCYSHKICKPSAIEEDEIKIPIDATQMDCPPNIRQDLCPMEVYKNVSTCSHQSDCFPGYKCCLDTCVGKSVCKLPANAFALPESEEVKETDPQNGLCPTLTGKCTKPTSLRLARNFKCATDYDCYQDEVCCRDDCVKYFKLCKKINSNSTSFLRIDNDMTIKDTSPVITPADKQENKPREEKQEIITLMNNNNQKEVKEEKEQRAAEPSTTTEDIANVDITLSSNIFSSTNVEKTSDTYITTTTEINTVQTTENHAEFSPEIEETTGSGTTSKLSFDIPQTKEDGKIVEIESHIELEKSEIESTLTPTLSFLTSSKSVATFDPCHYTLAGKTFCLTEQHCRISEECVDSNCLSGIRICIKKSASSQTNNLRQTTAAIIQDVINTTNIITSTQELSTNVLSTTEEERITESSIKLERLLSAPIIEVNTQSSTEIVKENLNLETDDWLHSQVPTNIQITLEDNITEKIFSPEDVAVTESLAPIELIPSNSPVEEDEKSQLSEISLENVNAEVDETTLESTETISWQTHEATSEENDDATTIISSVKTENYDNNEKTIETYRLVTSEKPTTMYREDLSQQNPEGMKNSFVEDYLKSQLSESDEEEDLDNNIEKSIEMGSGDDEVENTDNISLHKPTQDEYTVAKSDEKETNKKDNEELEDDLIIDELPKSELIKNMVVPHLTLEKEVDIKDEHKSNTELNEDENKIRKRSHKKVNNIKRKKNQHISSRRKKNRRNKIIRKLILRQNFI